MSHDLVRLRQEIERAAEDYGFCVNRVWQTGSQLKGQESELCGPIQRFCEEYSSSLKKALSHEDHSSCTFDFCEFSSRDFTAVQQYHERGRFEEDDEAKVKRNHANRSICFPLSGLFREDVLLKGVNAGSLTAWRLNGQALLKHPRPFMAVSHVWSDGTGAGPWGPGNVNDCLLVYFKRIAERFHCEGIWWDTLCIPQDKVARSRALNTMHLNYQYARITLVHDRFLRKLPFRGPQSACLAIVLSSWFTRGWTALELAKSQKVKIIFMDTIKDLDEDILDKAGDNLAAAMISNLRNNEILEIEDLLSTLGPRYTSWLKDRAIIAGLLTGIDTLQSPSGETIQRHIYQSILLKLKKISHDHLFHTSATMSEGFSWFPTNLFQLPRSAQRPKLTINDKGEVIGEWKVVSPRFITLQDCVWDVSHPLVEAQVRYSLEKEKEKHVLLFPPIDEAVDQNANSKALLVEVFRSGGASPFFKCRYVGSLRLQSALQDGGQSKQMLINLGDTQGCRPLLEQETAWNVIDNCQMTPDGQLITTNPSRSEIFSGGKWGVWHHAAWLGDPALIGDETSSWDQKDEADQSPIHLAAERGNHDIVAEILHRGHNRGVVFDKGGAFEQTPLHYAAWGGSLKTLELLLNSQSDAEAKDKFGNSALHIAADMGYEDIVRRLCNFVPVSAKGRNGLTPLHYAAMSGHNAVAQWLLKKGADIEATGQELDWTPLHCAAGSGHYELVELLLKHRASVVAKDERVKWTPLHLAAINGHIRIMNTLIRPTARLQTKDLHGWTPQLFADLIFSKATQGDQLGNVGWTLLHLEAIDGRRDIIRLLLDTEKGATLRAVEIIPANHLHKAAEWGYYRAVRTLIHNGFAVNQAVDNYDELDILRRLIYPQQYTAEGLTALHLAASEGRSKTVWILLENGADVDKEVSVQPGPHFLTAMHLAALHGCYRTISALIEKGASLSPRSLLGIKPIHYAIRCGHKQVAEKLMEAGAEVIDASETGASALVTAVFYGHEDLFDMVFDRHNSMITKEVYGAVCTAAENGRLTMLEKLLSRGASATANIGGTTALHLAAEKGHEEIVDLLIRDGADVHAKITNGKQRLFSYAGGYSRNHYRSGNLIGYMALHFAAANGHEEVIEKILAMGASIECRNAEMETPLHLAAYAGRVKAVQKLVGKGAKVDALAWVDSTPLHYVAGDRFPVEAVGFLGGSEKTEQWLSNPGYAAVAEILLEKEPSLIGKKERSTGNTALHKAAEAGRHGVINKLLDRGASADRKNDKGETARELALYCGHKDIAETLQAHELNKRPFRRLLDRSRRGITG